MAWYDIMTAVEVIEEIENMPVSEKSHIIKYLEILKEHRDIDNDEMHPDWKEIIDRRTREIEEGKVETITSEEVYAYARERLNDTRKVSS